MAETVANALLPGLALGSVVAVAATWARLARNGDVPHLAVGATAGVAVALAGRLAESPWPVVLAAAAVVGVVLGSAGSRLDARISQLRLSGLPAPPPQLADAVLLAAAVGLAELLRAPLALPVVLGPLGGQPGTAQALAAVLVGLSGVGVLAATGRGIWPLAGAATAMSAVLAAGALAPGAAGLGLPPAADPAGLALRALAAALAGGTPLGAAAVALALGLGETLTGVIDPALRWGAALWVAAGVVGILRVRLAPTARSRQEVRR